MMDKRFFLALLLTAAVVILTPLVFQTPRRAPAAAVSAPAATPGQDVAPDGATPGGPAVPAPAGEFAQPAPSPSLAPDLAAAADSLLGAPPDTAVVTTPLARYAFSSHGAAPVSVVMRQFESLRIPGGEVDLVRPGEQLLSYAVVAGGDTIALDEVPFQLEQTTSPAGSPTLNYSAIAEGARVAIAYSFVPDSYLVRVRGRVEGVPSPAYLLVNLPSGLRSEEADSLDDQRHLAYAFKPTRDDATSVPFSKLDPGDPPRLQPGPIGWVAAKSKYFVVGLLTDSIGQRFAELTVAPAPRSGRVAASAEATAIAPLGADGFTFEMYAGPQEWRRLNALGRDFQNVNPYGGWFQGMIQPFATIVMRTLLWMRDTTQLNYGWVLVIFGVVVRLAMWPLNQGAMRASIKMQRIQPELQEAQQRHKANPEKQREEIMRIYKEHNMSPFSTLAGCLPMLLPMPILFALFFVFQNTIEFRGVPFLWLADISLKDPYYILPLLMALTTFLVSWIGMRNAPANPQARMIAYVMPVMLVFFLANMAAGLNLYYTVQNLAALPQQWLIAHERSKHKPAGKPAPPPPPPVPAAAATQGKKRRA